MNQKLDDDEIISKLEIDAEQFKLQSNFSACFECMKLYEDETYSPYVRCIAYLTHARCAIEANDFDEARIVVNKIDRTNISDEVGIYVDKMLLQVLEHDGELERTKQILLKNLAKPEILEPEQLEVHHEMIGWLGRILTDLGEYERALPYLEEGEKYFEHEPWRDSLGIRKAYSLRMLGRESEAESILKNLLEIGSGKMLVDIFYELGMVYWTMRRFGDAQSMLEFAADNIPCGLRTSAEIRDALIKLNAQMTAGELSNMQRLFPPQ
jgi:tetratricopeptide (TPR) repeat protein